MLQDGVDLRGEHQGSPEHRAVEWCDSAMIPHQEQPSVAAVQDNGGELPVEIVHALDSSLS